MAIMTNMKPVILSGGAGSKLWPLSSHKHPKQFLKLTCDQTMFTKTWERITEITDIPPLIIANKDHSHLVKAELKKLNNPKAQIVFEDVGRNTAPAIAIAALIAATNNPDEILVILPSDHEIQDVKAFQEACVKADLLAKQDYLVTFGIEPQTPNTNYGYIKRGSQINACGYHIDNFIEKPDLKTAEQYIASNQYLWNSGIYIFKTSVYLSELKKYKPDIYCQAKMALEKSIKINNSITIQKEHLAHCENISIDHAVMEHTQNGAVIPLDANWCDIGSWDRLCSVAQKDDNGNFVSGDVNMTSSTNCYIYNKTDKPIDLIDAHNLIIIKTDDGVYIKNKRNNHLL